MRILKYKGKLIEEVGYTTNEKVVYFKFLRSEDKDKCPHCNGDLETEHNIVENCPNWQSHIEGVKTLTKENLIT